MLKLFLFFWGLVTWSLIIWFASGLVWHERGYKEGFELGKSLGELRPMTFEEIKREVEKEHEN